MQKSKKKQHQKSKPKVVRKPGEPVFRYTSVCCGMPATKQALVMPTNNHIGRLGAAPETEGASLGSWRCTKCNKPCKCTRSKNKPEAEVSNA